MLLFYLGGMKTKTNIMETKKYSIDMVNSRGIVMTFEKEFSSDLQLSNWIYDMRNRGCKLADEVVVIPSRI